MWHKPCRTFHPWCSCIKTRCLWNMVAQYNHYKMLLKKKLNRIAWVIHTHTPIQTCLLILNLMLWYRQAIFQFERRQVVFLCWMQDSNIEIWDTKLPAKWMPTHKLTELSRIKQKLKRSFMEVNHSSSTVFCSWIHPFSMICISIYAYIYIYIYIYIFIYIYIYIYINI